MTTTIIDQALTTLLPSMSPAAQLDAARRVAASGDLDAILRLARSAGCPASVLESLAGHKRAAVREAVAGAANTPSAVRAKLRTDKAVTVRRAAGGSRRPAVIATPEEVEDRDALEKLLADDPKAFAERVRRSDLPQVALEIMLDRGAGLPDEVLVELARCRQMFLHENAEVFSGERLAAGLEATGTELTVDEATNLVFNPISYSAYSTVAQWAAHFAPAIAPAVATATARPSGSWKVRQLVAAFPGTSKATLARLAVDSDWDVATQALFHPVADVDVLMVVTGASLRSADVSALPCLDSPEKVATALAAGVPIVVSSVLEGKLAGDPAMAMAMAVAGPQWLRLVAAESRLPLAAEQMLALAGDEDAEVRQAVAARADVTREAARACGRHEVPWVALRVLTDEDLLDLPWQDMVEQLGMDSSWLDRDGRIARVVGAQLSALHAESPAALETLRGLADTFTGTLGELLGAARALA